MKTRIAASLPALLLVVGVCAAQFDGLPAELPGRSASHKVTGYVGLVRKVKVPAPEAGVLTYVGVREGSRFRAEDRIAEIDSREVKMSHRIAGYELKLANARANDDVRIVFATKQEGAEYADYEGVLRVNQANPDTVPETDVRREKLEWEQAVASIERAKKDKELAGLEADVKRAEMEATTLALEKRIIRSNFAGEVLKLHRKEGEWVQPGDTIVEIAQLDTLQVEGSVYFKDYTQREIANCRVTVRVDAGGGRGVVEAPGYIVWASPIVEAETELFYEIRAEFANRQENGQWLINPGLPVQMEIHLGTQGEAQVGQRNRQGEPAR